MLRLGVANYDYTEVIDGLAEGDKVAVEANGYAELLDGRAYDCQYHFLITIRGGMIGDVKEYMDTQHAKETFFGG